MSIGVRRVVGKPSVIESAARALSTAAHDPLRTSDRPKCIRVGLTFVNQAFAIGWIDIYHSRPNLLQQRRRKSSRLIQGRLLTKPSDLDKLMRAPRCFLNILARNIASIAGRCCAVHLPR